MSDALHIEQPEPYTKVENWFIAMMGSLTMAELKVGLFLYRRIRGFHKATDHISLSQFERGIKGRDGMVLENGTGLSRQSIIDAIRSLERRSIIEVERRRTPYGDFDVNQYSFKSRVGGPSTDPSSPAKQGRHVKSASGKASDHASDEASRELEVAAHSAHDRASSDEQPNVPASVVATAFVDEQPVAQAGRMAVAGEQPAVTQTGATKNTPDVDERIVEQLVEAGVARVVAVELVRHQSPDDIAFQMEVLPYRKPKTPGAMLVAAIRNAWPAPQAWARKARQLKSTTATLEQVARSAADEARERDLEVQLDAFITLLEPSRRQSLENQAMQMLLGEAPMWKSRKVPAALLKAYRNQVAEQWMNADLEPAPALDAIADTTDLPAP